MSENIWYWWMQKTTTLYLGIVLTRYETQLTLLCCQITISIYHKAFQFTEVCYAYVKNNNYIISGRLQVKLLVVTKLTKKKSLTKFLSHFQVLTIFILIKNGIQ